MSIAVLGPLRAQINGADAELSGVKLRGVLAVLALRAGQDVRRDELIEELDLTRTTGDAVNAVHAHVRRLRRWLKEHGMQADVLETVNSGYRLNVDRHAVDAHRFRHLVEQGLNLAPTTPSVVAAILEEALSLWRSEALTDTLHGAMTVAAAEELRQWRTSARDALLDAWLALDQNHKVILHAPKFIADDPLNESLCARHIAALHRVGRCAEAVQSYRDTERTLRQELGVEPGVELRTAYGLATHSMPPDALRERIELSQLS
ncbi:BTAD domain-containing putative transcriptional regulator [Streptomyces monticola]|uniref:BTAD domain-containing putative transcriptional regulator n=1 Tax=Streptomyces monticola TaxID=2666263 RepID=A0ABW2JVJ2_9ACTN